ncbi:MAG: hypothetical protein R3E08_09705 [Thiotrichaceae bacterium]
MKMITIPENEYLQMQQQLQRQLKQSTRSLIFSATEQPVSIKRGSAKKLITYIAEDFTEPLPDFQDYTS